MDQRTKIHPKRYMMWMAIVSIIMMFVGLSSAFIVKRSQANWVSLEIPLVFFYSTGVILASSLTVAMAKRAFGLRQISRYAVWLGAAAVLGILFVVLQTIGFIELWNSGVTVSRNVSFSFLYVIVGLHALHVLGGVVALIVMFIKSFSARNIVYSPLGINLMATYWHFVDILWIYLLIFMMIEG
ncbi:MAG TPA: cytochrome c oxidase subunit 3 [Ginsengibacter sp.]|nr:cytochrome c oxidase subunit 3 [Ginsengibacter sp.]HRP16460.1 cytochrome c oxidase subunit 3 [Ginsengibacter sp.]HRP43966.1 cytochrome c oxidase subunit 3 [Ginsengibacter sp.]